MQDPFVWVRDQLSGHSHTITREALALNPDRYVADERHPVRDELGNLLPTKFHADKGSVREASEATTKAKKEAN